MIGENVPHQASAGRKEVTLILPIDCFKLRQPQVSFVNKSGRLKGVSWVFPRHIALRRPVQLVVDQRNQRFYGAGSPLLQARSRDVISIAEGEFITGRLEESRKREQNNTRIVSHLSNVAAAENMQRIAHLVFCIAALTL